MRNCAIIHPLHLELETANRMVKRAKTALGKEFSNTDKSLLELLERLRRLMLYQTELRARGLLEVPIPSPQL